MASIEWLEQELSTIDAAVILVAHDRWFLESVATSVLELEGGRSVFFPGKWHVWRQEKAARLANQAKWAERQAEDIARLERFVARFRYGTKSRQAQAKLKQIARIEAVRVEAPRGERRTLGFEFLKPARSGRMVIEAEGFDLAAGTKPLLEDAELVLERGEHVALIGPNGSGKSTLLEAIVGGGSAGSATASSSRTSPSTRSSWTSAAACSSARWARPGCSGRRRRRSSGASSSRAGTTHEKPVVAALGRRAPPARAGADRRLRRELPRARRADEPPRPREPRGARGRARGVSRARCCSSRTTARCSTPSPSGSSPSRTARCARTRAAGPTTSASAPTRTRPRRRAEGDARRRQKPARPKPPATAASSSRSRRSIEAARGGAGRARAAARRGLGRRRDARGPQGRARRPPGPARALGGALRVGAGLGVTIGASGGVDTVCRR